MPDRGRSPAQSLHAAHEQSDEHVRSRAAVIVASTRAAAGVYDDTSGRLLEQWLIDRGFVVDRVVVADGPQIGRSIGEAADAGARVVITSGGTGVSPTDQTPEQTAAYLDRRLPGIAEALRRAGAEQLPAAVLSRGLAGVTAGRCLIVNLAGSLDAARTGITVLDPLLDHVLHQLVGADHERSASAHARVQPADAGSGTGSGTQNGEQPARGVVVHASVCDEALHTSRRDTLRAMVETPQMGAIVDFVGIVRDHDGGRGVQSLAYSAHPAATQLLCDVAERIAARYPVRLAVQHTVGDLDIGDAAVYAAVASAHRQQAFAACADLIDELKRDVPIWKRQRYDDDDSEWLG